MIRAIRGAVTCENTRESICEGAKVMLEQIISKNALEIEQVVAVTFTCTKDLNAAYPAIAAREIGLTAASLMCLAEMDVPGSLEKCVRVQVLAEMDVPQKDVRHVYLRDARVLRLDLAD